MKRQAKLCLGASAIIFVGGRQDVLLTRCSDNGRRCLPVESMEPGESVEEACIRGVLEETGLVEVTRLMKQPSMDILLVMNWIPAIGWNTLENALRIQCGIGWKWFSGKNRPGLDFVPSPNPH